MTIRPLSHVSDLVVALTFAGAVALVPPISAHAADRHAPAARAETARAPSKRVEAQIAELQKKLHITDAQMPQWNALAAAMRENAARVELSRADRAKIHPTNIIDDLYADRRETQARLERLERIIPVAEALYAVLNDEQKPKADTLFASLRRHHEPMMDIDD